MSKQRPYGTFEEAYVIQMLTRIPEVFDDLVLSLIDADILLDKVPAWRYIQLPFRFYDEPLICEYWNGLCRMYGSVFTFDRMNYILAENLDLCIYHLVDLIDYIFPPGWNIIRDKPILSLDEIQFM